MFFITLFFHFNILILGFIIEDLEFISLDMDQHVPVLYNLFFKITITLHAQITNSIQIHSIDKRFKTKIMISIKQI